MAGAVKSEERKYALVIPPNSRDGLLFEFAGEANHLDLNAPPGDLRFVVRENVRHRSFRAHLSREITDLRKAHNYRVSSSSGRSSTFGSLFSLYRIEI